MGNARPARRRVDGVLLLDKPSGLSSNVALQRAKRIFEAEKAGHTGTLDPMASGLLPICFGEATKFARFLLEAPKRYQARFRFGIATATQDAEGPIVETRPVTIGAAQIEAALSAFIGALRQTPPAFSALKYRGRSYYEYAREGIEIPRVAREITIERMVLMAWSAPDATFDILCSKGTYVRTLAADLGSALGCGAHVAGLRRMASGGFEIGSAVSLDALEALAPDARDALLLPLDRLLETLPRLELDGDRATRLCAGQSIDVTELQAECARAYDREGHLLGVVRQRGGTVSPERMTRWAAALAAGREV